VTLLTLRAGLLAAAACGPYHTSELALVTQVWAALPEHAVVILDRGLCSYALFHVLGTPTATGTGRCAPAAGTPPPRRTIVERFGSGDALVELGPSPPPAPSIRTSPPPSASALSACSAAAFARTGSAGRC
jgi:hypothetical protein